MKKFHISGAIAPMIPAFQENAACSSLVISGRAGIRGWRQACVQVMGRRLPATQTRESAAVPHCSLQ
jgi:hypothetical protein